MHTTTLLHRNGFLAACGLAFVSLALAQPPQIPDAPTVPMAPTLPDAAVIKEPLQPAASQEIIEERPSQSHVWIAGHWGWRLGRHVWISGHWDLPPRGNVVWVEPRWERRGSGYVFVEGYWHDATPVRYVGGGPREAVIIQVPPPPPPRSEPRP